MEFHCCKVIYSGNFTQRCRQIEMRRQIKTHGDSTKETLSESWRYKDVNVMPIDYMMAIKLACCNKPKH